MSNQAGNDPSVDPSRPQTRSRAKTWLFRAIVVGASIMLAEILSLLAIVTIDASPQRFFDQRRFIAQSDPARTPLVHSRPAMIHPYLGAVLQPEPESEGSLHENEYRITEFGFRDTRTPIRKRGSDRLIVAVLGGSVARQFAWNGHETLARELSTIPGFAGRSVEFVRLAIDGHKQPQQVMTLTYLLTLGAEFDLVINLDGVNEAALPKIDNVSNGICTTFPRKWEILTASSTSLEYLRKVGYVTYLRQQQQDWAALFETFPWNYSPTGLLLWKVGNDRRDLLISAQLKSLSVIGQESASYGILGPREKFDSDRELYEHCVEIWARSSIQLHQICAANRAQYFHFLQPNQHVQPLTKPMHREEAKFFSTESEFREPVIHCYPLMRARAAEFSRAGVVFCDLTGVFSDHPEPIYGDDCCHMRATGDEIMARAIGQWIREFYLAAGH